MIGGDLVSVVVQLGEFQLKMLLQPKKTEAHKELGGFIKIGKLFPTYWNWET